MNKRTFFCVQLPKMHISRLCTSFSFKVVCGHAGCHYSTRATGFARYGCLAELLAAASELRPDSDTSLRAPRGMKVGQEAEQALHQTQQRPSGCIFRTGVEPAGFGAS